MTTLMGMYWEPTDKELATIFGIDNPDVARLLYETEGYESPYDFDRVYNLHKLPVVKRYMLVRQFILSETNTNPDGCSAQTVKEVWKQIAPKNKIPQVPREQ